MSPGEDPSFYRCPAVCTERSAMDCDGGRDSVRLGGRGLNPRETADGGRPGRMETAMNLFPRCGRGLALLAALGCLLPARVLAAGGGSAEAIVFVADSRRYSGFLAWFTNLYNENLAYFTLMTVVLIPVLALLLSAVMSFFLARTGIDLKSKAVGGH